MDFIDISNMRVTARQFDKRPVEQDKIRKILEAGRCFPTAVNAQPQRILVLDTPDNIQKVRGRAPLATIKNMLTLQKNAAIKNMANVITATAHRLYVFVCHDKTACLKHPQNGKLSGATEAMIVAAHMMLETASIGLGTV